MKKNLHDNGEKIVKIAGVLLSLIAIPAGFAIVFSTNKSIVFSYDLWITNTLQSIDTVYLLQVMRAVSFAGYAPQSFILTVTVVAFFYFSRKQREAVCLLLAAVSSQLLNYAIKFIVQRPRPVGETVRVDQIFREYSFPSGHVMFYTVFFGLLIYWTRKNHRDSWRRKVLLTLFGSMIFMVGISRVYLGAHWASDVLCGYLLSGAVLYSTVKIYKTGEL